MDNNVINQDDEILTEYYKHFKKLYYEQAGGDDEYLIKSFKLIERLAKQDDAEAQNFYAHRYYFGIATQQDYQTAFRWYQKSAIQGFSEAQFNLGFMYLSGTGIEKDEKKGIELIEKSASQNNSQALLNLGIMYSKGLHSKEKNNITAYEYLKKAYQLNNKGASVAYGSFAASFIVQMCEKKNLSGVEKNILIDIKRFIEATYKPTDETYLYTKKIINELLYGQERRLKNQNYEYANQNYQANNNTGCLILIIIGLFHIIIPLTVLAVTK